MIAAQRAYEINAKAITARRGNASRIGGVGAGPADARRSPPRSPALAIASSPDHLPTGSAFAEAVERFAERWRVAPESILGRGGVTHPGGSRAGAGPLLVVPAGASAAGSSPRSAERQTRRWRCACARGESSKPTMGGRARHRPRRADRRGRPRPELACAGVVPPRPSMRRGRLGGAASDRGR